MIGAVETMKKRILSCLMMLICLMLSMSIVSMPVFADSESEASLSDIAPDRYGEGLNYVTDQADILSDDEENDLSARAAAISDAYQCMVYIVTVDDFTKYCDWYNIEYFADDLREAYNLGYGSDHDLVLLLLSMSDRDYDLMAHGDFGNASFTDYGKEVMEDKFLDNFKNDDWYGGFSDYLDQCEKLLKQSAKGRPLDINTSVRSRVISGIFSGLIGLVISWVVCEWLRSRMRPAAIKNEARSYVPDGGVQITNRRDVFVRTTVNRIYSPRSKDSGGGGGHGGTSVSSSGSSHSSGKF